MSAQSQIFQSACEHVASNNPFVEEVSKHVTSLLRQQVDQLDVDPDSDLGEAITHWIAAAISRKAAVQRVRELLTEENAREEEVSALVAHGDDAIEKQITAVKNVLHRRAKGIEAARVLASYMPEFGSDLLRQIVEARYPECVRKYVENQEDLEDFLTDLAALMLEESSDTRVAVTGICKDPSFALDFLQIEDTPKPVRYLAELELRAVIESARE